MSPRNPVSTLCRTVVVLAVLIQSAIRAGAADAGELYVTNFNKGTIDRYDTIGGAIGGGRVVSLVSGLTIPTGIVVSGNDIFVESFVNGTIGEYNATTGAVINASLITGLNMPFGLAILGSDLFVTNQGSSQYGGSIGEYTITGQTVNAALVTGLARPQGIVVGGAISGNANALYVATAFSQSGSEGVSEFNTLGGTVSANFISDTFQPSGLALAGTTLYVSNLSNGTIPAYNANTGALLSSSVTSGGAANPEAIAVDAAGSNLYVANTTGSPNAFVDGFTLPSGTLNADPGLGEMDAPAGLFQVPEPSDWAALAFGAAALLGHRRRSPRS